MEPASTTPDYRRPFITITMLFFLWGFITVMNDVLIPYLKNSFQLSYFQAGLVQFAFFGAFFFVSLLYYFISLSQGDPINRIGYKKSIIVALLVCGAGCAMFYPAAEFRQYGLFLAALFMLATGVTLLQIAANPYAAILGKPETASSRLNLAQGVNSMGTTLAPIAGGLLLYKVFAEDGQVTIDSIKMPYLIYGSMFLILAIIVWFSHLPRVANEEKLAKGLGALRFPHLRYGMVAIFMYVGGEVAIGSYLINFMMDEGIMGLAEADASIYLAYYWGGAMIGRLCGAISLSEIANQSTKYFYMAATGIAVFFLVYLVTAIRIDDGVFSMKFMTPQQIAPYFLLIALNFVAFVFGRGHAARVLGVFSLGMITLLCIAAFTGGSVAFWAALGTGLFNSIMWSNIFTLSIKDLKQYTSQGSSLLVMMIVGGAIVPLVMGAAADHYGIQLAFAVPIINYAYIAFFGFAGHKVQPMDAVA
ncbi:sugar MFS transporter [Allorhodopirellula heiligendammensis]|uniref:L-fucose-proton symporter n=1 Tax=Allorhodopirellula heiligendammensis TaxID=2714739 RepID=A0A5C6C6W2_9BACT|nr:sugar MFS transporter [Allorhodopirellula heiligendammensis]TWU18519.1 L-fucose-proton symporter [Allorhodopirellula heiligendammensis]